MKTPILETNRLILRPFCLEDAQEIFECWESDPDVAKYMFWSSHNDINKTIEWVKKELSQIDADDWYRWAILSKKTGALLGTGLIYIEEEYSKFVDNRNTDWMTKLPALLRESPCFISVDALHLGGKYGLIQQLEKDGYKVKAVEKTPNL